MKQTLLTLLPLALGATLSVHAQRPTAPRPAAKSAQTSDRDPFFRHIPPDADHVYHLNVPVLFREMTWSQLLEALPIPPRNMDPLSLARFREYFKESGIDFSREMIIATTNEGHLDSFQYLTVIFHLADSGKYIRYLHSKIKPLRPQPIRGTHAEGSMMTGTAFTDTLGVFIASQPPKYENPAVKPVPSIEWQMVNGRRAAAALKGFDRSFFATNPAFQEDFNDGADMHFYSRTGTNMTVVREILRSISQKGEVLDMVNSLEHARPTTGSLSTANGKLTYISRQQADPAERRIPDTSSERLLEAIPGDKKILGMASVRIDIGTFLAMAGKRGKIHDAFTQLAISAKDYQAALDGHLLLVCFEPDQATVDTTGNMKPILIGMARIGDRSTFDKLMIRLDSLHIMHAVNDDLAFFGKDQGQVRAFAYSSPGRKTGLAPEPFLTSPAGFTFNLYSAANFLSQVPPANDTAAANIHKLVPLMQLFDNFTLATGAVENGRSTAWLQLTLDDPSKSPILTLLQMMKNLPRN
ncbi:MAG TPA: hypothetical protein VGE93_22650 [Bryobacteraceae bacterium]